MTPRRRALALALVALIAMPPPAFGSDYRATYPPARYDHHYRRGPVVEHLLPRHAAIALCESKGMFGSDGCAWMRGTACHIVMSASHPPDVLRSLRRHEHAHCNGWPPDHPGAR